MADQDDIARAANTSSVPLGSCAVCGGTGGTVVPCTACGGTGRTAQPGPSWLSAWRYDGAMAGGDTAVITAGLPEQDGYATVLAALDARGSGPVCYVREGHDITPLGDRPFAHYDQTGQCHGPHPHVAWDMASANIDELTTAVQQLVTTVVDPDAAWTPPSDATFENFAAFINPAIWNAVPAATVALWTAGSSGQGTRVAMDWLSSGQLAHMFAYCRPLEQRLGRGALPLMAVVAELLAAPEYQRQAAVHHAWQALAPVEEAIRASAHAQRLDLRAWLTSSQALAVSLPPGASVAQRQTAVAMLMAARGLPEENPPLPRPGVIWHDVAPPHPKGDWLWAQQRPCLALTSGAAGFASWTTAAWGARQPAWLLGSAADRSVLEAASRRLGVADVPVPAAGQALLVQDGGQPVLLTSAAS